MTENGNVTMDDLMNAISKVANQQDIQHDELKRGIAEVKRASETAHKEIIERLERLEGRNE